jgi:hypothetical protein
MEFFSVGEQAHGFIAIGQQAKGVIAIGQLATGVIAIGQLAKGCFTIGQLAFGFIGCWVVLDLFFDGHGLGLGHEGSRLPIKLDRRLQADATALTVHGPSRVWAFVRTIDGTRVCERIVHVPPRPFEKPNFYVLGAVQFALLCVLATAWWLIVGDEILGILASI